MLRKERHRTIPRGGEGCEVVSVQAMDVVDEPRYEHTMNSTSFVRVVRDPFATVLDAKPWLDCS